VNDEVELPEPVGYLVIENNGKFSYPHSVYRVRHNADHLCDQMANPAHVEPAFTAEQLRAAVCAERQRAAQVCEEYETANEVAAAWQSIIAETIRKGK
jgi:hypothetical protein